MSKKPSLLKKSKAKPKPVVATTPAPIEALEVLRTDDPLISILSAPISPSDYVEDSSEVLRTLSDCSNGCSAPIGGAVDVQSTAVGDIEEVIVKIDEDYKRYKLAYQEKVSKIETLQKDIKDLFEKINDIYVSTVPKAKTKKSKKVKKE